MAGAVFRASRKGCGTPGRRGPRLLSAWQAQYLEPPERVLARLVAVGRGFCLRGRNSTWSLQKGLRRAWSPLARGSCLCGRRSTQSPAAPVCVEGAVFRASRKGCGAPGRRGPRLLSAWQAQYLEPPERVLARLVAVGRGFCLRGRNSTWSLQKGLRRAWSPLARGSCVAGAVLRAPRLLSVWQAQYSEPLERVAARLVAAGPRLLSLWQAQYSEPLERVAARLVAAGPRLLSLWQAQYSEPLARVAARLVAAGPRLLSRWRAGSVCAAGAVLRASRKGCGAPGRRWPAAPVCVAGAVLRASRKGCGAPGRRWPAGCVSVAGVVFRASRKGCGAPGRR